MIISQILPNIPDQGAGSMEASRSLVMVCLSPSPSCRRVIRAAARMAAASPSIPMALYVGISGREADEDSRLRENIQYARDNGFEVHTTRGSDIPLAISEYARREGVTDLFLGYSPPSFIFQAKPAINDKLLSYLPTVDIHIIPDPVSSPYAGAIQKKTGSAGQPVWDLRDLLLVLGVMAVATVLSSAFYVSRYSNSNIITIYILAVLIASVMTSSRIYGTLAAVLYVLLFNFLFIEPRFTLLVYNSAYLMTYLVTVIAALITGTVAVRLKNIARVSAENAYQAKVLLDTSNQLEGAADSGEVIHITCMQLVHLLARTVVFFPAPARGSAPEASGTDGRTDQDGAVPETSGTDSRADQGRAVPEASGNTGLTAPGGPLPADGPRLFPAGEKTLSPELLDREQDAVRWTRQNSHQSGAFTSHFSDCSCRYLSVFSGANQYGVIGIDMEGRPFTEFENTILLSIVHEGTMALENKRIMQEQKKTEIRAENERLRAGLLRSISHDLRTPLTSICGNASNLHSHENDLPREDRDRIYKDIMEDAGWLSAQFENILAMTKLESGLEIQNTVENMEDVIEESLRHIPPHPAHRILFVSDAGADRIPLARMDPRLIMQVLINLLGNAVKYTPDGSQIEVRLTCTQNRVVVEAADNGPGIPDEDKPHIFELFYAGRHTLSDSYRSMGIGLNLCAQILAAHGGGIEVLDNVPAGAVFRFWLPSADIPEVGYNE